MILCDSLPDQNSKIVDRHSCAEYKRNWQIHIYSLVPTFITWCFDLIRPAFSVSFRLSFYKSIKRIKNLCINFISVEDPQKKFLKIKNLNIRLILHNSKKAPELSEKKSGFFFSFFSFWSWATSYVTFGQLTFLVKPSPIKTKFERDKRIRGLFYGCKRISFHFSDRFLLFNKTYIIYTFLLY